MTTAAILAELRAVVREEIRAALESHDEPLVYTRAEAAKALRISISQLYRLIATGKLWAQPSGITREAMHAYLARPQSKVRAAQSRGKAQRTATEEAERGRALLKAQRRPRGAI